VIESTSIRYIDSCESLPDNQCSSIIIEWLYNTVFPKEGFSSVVLSVDQQTNDYDCGLHVCRFAECEYYKLDMTTRLNMEMYRENLVKFFKDHLILNSQQ